MPNNNPRGDNQYKNPQNKDQPRDSDNKQQARRDPQDKQQSPGGSQRSDTNNDHTR